MENQTTTIIDPEVQSLLLMKKSGFNYRQRRQEDWKEIYTLYRDKVTINRLTQRQSVNIPLMKMFIRTLLKDVDDMPVLQFENLDNDKQKELFLNKYWEYTVEENRMDLKDIVDKKQDFLFGRTFDQMQIADGKVLMTIEDPEDMLVDRYCDPTDIDSSRFLIHTHIFLPFSTLEKNTDYDQTKVAKLKEWYATEQGIIRVASNSELAVEKNKKMADMGVPDVDNPILGEAITELSLYFVYDRKTEKDDEELFLKVEAENQVILMKKPLEEVIGVTEDHYWKNHFPYNSWADDVERQDFWSDGFGDIIKTPNKVANVWFSQMVENRTLRNYNMNIYDSTVEGFVPQTYEAIPFGWYGVPGKPADVYQRLQVDSLDDTLNDMNFLIGTLEKATGATATQQGVQTESKITLGEVQLALGEAKERIKGISKFYTSVWKQRGIKFLKLIEAAPEKLNAVKLYTKGRNTSDVYGKDIEPSDWQTKSGYNVKVWSQEEKSTHDMKNLEKLSAVMTNMPGNTKLLEIYQRKLLEIADITPEELNEVMRIEKEKMMNPLLNPQNGTTMNGGMGGQSMPTVNPVNQVRPALPPKTQ
jgi:hypothetical protein